MPNSEKSMEKIQWALRETNFKASLSSSCYFNKDVNENRGESEYTLMTLLQNGVQR